MIRNRGPISSTVNIEMKGEEAESFWRRFLSKKKADRSGMDKTDQGQQDQIERLQTNSRFLFLMLVINLAASIAQILECWKIWNHGIK